MRTASSLRSVAVKLERIYIALILIYLKGNPHPQCRNGKETVALYPVYENNFINGNKMKYKQKKQKTGNKKYNSVCINYS